MLDDLTETGADYLKAAFTVGETYVVSQVQKQLMPHIMRVFTEHGAMDLKAFILNDYPLVEEHTPQGVKNALHNLGTSEEVADQFRQMMLQYVTPQNVINWMKNPDEWLDEAEADEQREELERCAKVLEQTEGGEVWLEEQILQLYKYGHVVPEDTTTASVNN